MRGKKEEEKKKDLCRELSTKILLFLFFSSSDGNIDKNFYIKKDKWNQKRSRRKGDRVGTVSKVSKWVGLRRGERGWYQNGNEEMWKKRERWREGEREREYERERKGERKREKEKKEREMEREREYERENERERERKEERDGERHEGRYRDR